MGNFNRGGDRGGFGGNRGGGFGGSRGGFGGGKSFGDRGGDRGGRNEMHDAICAGCQKSCQVPFRPNGKKPVFCTECFANNGGASKPSFNSFPKKDFGDRHDSRPAMRPAFNNDNAGAGNNDTKKQLETINIKLDRLIKAIEGMTKPATSEVKEVVKEVVKVVPTVKKEIPVAKVKKADKIVKKVIKSKK